MTTIGLIGAGRIGAMHAANIARLAGVELLIADDDSSRAAQVAAGLGCSAADDVDAVFAAQPDGVVIAVSTDHHVPLLLRAVSGRIPTFCEKPLASSSAASDPVLQAIETAGTTVQIGHQRRLDDGYLEARRAFRVGELGWLHTIRALTADQAPPPADYVARSGGLFRDCSVHDFDILQWVIGQPIVEVYARGSNNGDPAIAAAGDVDTGVCLATFDDGTLATVSATRHNGAGHDVRLELHGSAGTVHVGLDASYAGRSAEAGFRYPAGAVHSTFHERFASAFAREMAAFVALVRGSGDNPCPADEAVDAVRVADAAQASLESGAPVRVRR